MARRIATPVPTLRGPGGRTPVEFSDIDLEVMRRLMEQESPASIKKGMGLTAHAFDKVVLRPQFQVEYEDQCKKADRSIRGRLERLATEAIDVVRDVMRNAVSPGTKLRAATEILDRSGYVKVEKRVNLNMDAEAVIRELNRQGISEVPPVGETDETSDADIVTDEPMFEVPPAPPPRPRKPSLGRPPQDGDSIVEEVLVDFVDFDEIGRSVAKALEDEKSNETTDSQCDVAKANIVDERSVVL